MMEAVSAAGAKMPDELPAGPSIFQYSLDREFAQLLLGAGLEEPIIEQIAFTHHVDDLDAFWADVLGGTVRTMVMVTSQPPELQAGDPPALRRAARALPDRATAGTSPARSSWARLREAGVARTAQGIPRSPAARD